MAGPGGNVLSPEELVTLDGNHVWHPYAPLHPEMAPFVVRSATGAELYLSSPSGPDHVVVDAMASWWAAVHGYRNPVLDAAAKRQLDNMSHVMFGGLTHEPAVTLCRRLVSVLPSGLEHVFLCDSGSVSVEVAMKMALQAGMTDGRANRTRFLTWRGGYHGDTFMAMSVCDPQGGMHAMWSGLVAKQVFVERPPLSTDVSAVAPYIEHLEAEIERHRDELAGVIVEPIVQGAGGMRFHSPAIVGALRQITDKFGILLIFDEIATGFGRTGELFASDHAGVSPDIICIGKAMAGGYLSLAAAACTPEVASRVAASGAPAIMHGPTFMANPLACAIANASLDILASGQWRSQVANIEGWLKESLAPARGIPGVADVRALGAIAVVELDHDVDMARATSAALANGVWLRPFRNLIYAMPPFIVSEEQAKRVGQAMVAAAAVA